MTTSILRKLLASTATAAAGLVAVGGLAHALAVGDTLGTSEADITAALEAQGYAVEEFETENGGFEVEVMMNGQEIEIEIASDSGAVVEIESEDDEDDDSDDDDNDDDDDDDDNDDEDGDDEDNEVENDD